MPVKKVHVRDHERRKPEQEARIHVDDYNRTQLVNSAPPPGAVELGPTGHHGDIDAEVELIESIEAELHGEKRTCEKCGAEQHQDEMIRMPSGEWYCLPCKKTIPPQIGQRLRTDIREVAESLDETEQDLRAAAKEDLPDAVLVEELQDYPGYIKKDAEKLDRTLDKTKVEEVEAIERELHGSKQDKGWKQRGMKLLTQADRSTLPKLYATEAIQPEDKVLQVKFFTPTSNWTWYGVEFDGEDIFFGYVEGQENEWGYFSLKELSEVKGPYGVGIERDKFWKPTKFGDYIAKNRG